MRMDKRNSKRRVQQRTRRKRGGYTNYYETLIDKADDLTVYLERYPDDLDH